MRSSVSQKDVLCSEYAKIAGAEAMRGGFPWGRTRTWPWRLGTIESPKWIGCYSSRGREDSGDRHGPMSGQLPPCDIRQGPPGKAPMLSSGRLFLQMKTLKPLIAQERCCRVSRRNMYLVMERRTYWKEEEPEVKKLAWSLMKCERKIQMSKGLGEEYLEEKESCQWQ